MIAFFIGFALRKNKNKKAAEGGQSGLDESGTDTETKAA